MDNNKTKEDMVKEAVEEAKAAVETEEAEKVNPEELEVEETTAETNETEESKEGSKEPEESEEESTEKTESEGLFKKRKKKKDKRDEQIEELQDRVTRQMAEFDNFRKRTEKEKSAMYEIGARDIIEKILPVVDNFERGLTNIPENIKDNAFVDGMDKIYKQFITTLDEMDVKPIEAVGNEFNPDLHNAVMHIEDEEFGENVVTEEFLKGYTYRDTVVRHSMVKVAN